ncbi:hypothetical protein ACFVVM_33150 [Nocardia sp. NPDC058176]
MIARPGRQQPGRVEFGPCTAPRVDAIEVPAGTDLLIGGRVEAGIFGR